MTELGLILVTALRSNILPLGACYSTTHARIVQWILDCIVSSDEETRMDNVADLQMSSHVKDVRIFIKLRSFSESYVAHNYDYGVMHIHFL
jgi:hypothetical protein